MGRRCGVRAQYYKHHTGICMLDPHGPEVEHLVEVVTIETNKTDYSELKGEAVASGKHQCDWQPCLDNPNYECCTQEGCELQCRAPDRKADRRIYTDGGYRNGIGGWGWWCQETQESEFGSECPTTNQRMEMVAAIDAIDTFLGARNLTIVSDSAYLVNGATQQWYKRWERNGWTNVKGKPVANQDLWQKLAKFLADPSSRIIFEKVKGHSGDVGNDKADELATAGIIDYLLLRKKIDDLRELIHVHSLIYYHMNGSKLHDSTWDRWSKKLQHLQTQHPELAKGGYEAESFQDWTGATGMHLPRTAYAMERARAIVERESS